MVDVWDLKSGKLMVDPRNCVDNFWAGCIGKIIKVHELFKSFLTIIK